jgi:flagellar basal-body rod protein FlgB
MASLQEHLSVLSQALNLRTQRHQVLASNVANADTPNYKARDFSFESAMQNAMTGRVEGVSLTRTAPGHIGGGAAGVEVNLKYRSEHQSAVDGNTVDMDVERTQLAENAMQYQILTQLISEKFKGVRSALASTAS